MFKGNLAYLVIPEYSKHPHKHVNVLFVTILNSVWYAWLRANCSGKRGINDLSVQVAFFLTSAMRKNFGSLLEIAHTVASIILIV